MRVILDTNVVVSGLLWNGPPQRLLDAAKAGDMDLLTNQRLLDELKEVLQRPKFQKRFEQNHLNAGKLLTAYTMLAHSIDVHDIQPVVSSDPDDDIVIATAIAGGAAYIVTGDQHLLKLKSYRGISIVTAAQLENLTSNLPGLE